MPTLVVGASGATGQHLVRQLLKRGEHVRAIVRSTASLPQDISNHADLSIIQASVLDLSDQEMKEHARGCNAIASCLGHTLSFKGMFGPPHRLVTEAVERLCSAAQANQPEHTVKFVLMNTTGNRNHDLNEQVSIAEKMVIGLLRLLLPPHADNEDAANHLRTQIGQKDRCVQWVVVRPDALCNASEVTDISAHPSPLRSAIFNSGKTSRINVGSFMADLITDANLWNQWVGKMPVIYNRDN
ncbi:MAG: NAD(P)-dependent oxidoreductase [Gammaproteobacteria bacterium]